MVHDSISHANLGVLADPERFDLNPDLHFYVNVNPDRLDLVPILTLSSKYLSLK